MKKVILIPVFFLLVCTSFSQKILSFDDIRDSVMVHHPVLKMIDASRNAAEARAEGAFSWMPPDFGAGFFQTPYNPAKWKGTSSMPGMGMFMLSAEQMFPNKKSQQAEFDYLKSTGDIEGERKSGMLNDLMTQVRSAYYNLILIEKKNGLFLQNEKLLDFMLQSAEIRYKNNLGTMNSYYKLKAALAKLKTAQSVLEANKAQQMSIIINILQKDENYSFRIDTSFRWYSFRSIMDDENSLSKTSEYRVLEKTLISNNLQQLSSQTSLKPQFGVKFEHMVGFGHQPQMFSLMAMLKLPIAKWSARSTRAMIESLKYENESLKSQQYAYINKVSGMSKSLYAELQGIQNELRMYDEEIIPALVKNLQTLQISYEQNKTEIFELFDAWQNLLDARLEYLSSMQRGMELQSELLSIFQIIES